MSEMVSDPKNSKHAILLKNIVVWCQSDVRPESDTSDTISDTMSDIIELEHKKVAKLVRVSAQESRNLRSALSFAKYSSPGILARLLLEAFLFEDGDIHAEWFVRERACTKGSFTKLRDRLGADNWLHFRDDTKRYFPGVRLKPHLDAVKASKAVTFADLERKADRSELAALDARKADLASLDAKADRSELARVADDVQDLKAQIHQINMLMAELKRLQAPPPSAAAQLRSDEIVDEINGIMTKAGLKAN